MTTADRPWPDPKLHSLLRRLAFHPVPAQRSNRLLEQRSNRRGLSLEPADSRSYVQGDDPRHLDWGQLAKFDQLVVRQFFAQHALRVAIVLDCSKSMILGKPRKFDVARSLTACLGIIALQSGNELNLITSPAAEAHRIASSAVRDAHMANLLAKLTALQARGEVNVPDLLLRCATKPSDMLILISDCLPPQDLTGAFAAVAATGTRLIVLHTLCPEEREPPFDQPVTLCDPETRQQRRASGSKSAREAYIQALRRWRNDLSQNINRCGGLLIDISTYNDIETILAHQLSGLLSAP